MEVLCKSKLMLNHGGSFPLIGQLSQNSNVDVALSTEIQDSNLRSANFGRKILLKYSVKEETYVCCISFLYTFFFVRYNYSFFL